MNYLGDTQDSRLWKVSAQAGPLGFGVNAEIPYHPGLISEILKAEIIDPFTLLLQKVLHTSDFVGESFEGRGGRSPADIEVPVRKLRKSLATAKVSKQPVPMRVTGTFCTAVLLSYGWWERTTSGAKPVGHNEIQRWTYTGFDEWGPSWDFTSGEDRTGNESFFLGQLGHGDEANSVLVIAVGERARAIRSGIVGLMGQSKVAALAVELTGLLCHRRHLRQRNPELDGVAKHWNQDFNYCLLLDSDHHRITPIHEQPDCYSAYLWKCLWAKDNAPRGIPRLDDCYLIWEHTDLTKPDAIAYNLDSLQHKEDYLRKHYGTMELLQKSGPLITEEPAMKPGMFQSMLGTIGRM
jgi:hypothetical protein